MLGRTFCENGVIQDPMPGVPAVRTFYPNGKPFSIGFYQNDKLQDPGGGIPASTNYNRGGGLRYGESFNNGEFRGAITNITEVESRLALSLASGEREARQYLIPSTPLAARNGVPQPGNSLSGEQLQRG